MRRQPPEGSACYRLCRRILPLCCRCGGAGGNVLRPSPSLAEPLKKEMLPTLRMLPLKGLHKHFYAALARGLFEPSGGQNEGEQGSRRLPTTLREREEFGTGVYQEQR